MTESGEEKLVRRRLEYHGRVQGVGFRMTTASIAKQHPVVGYVKNLRGGTVEVVVEGTPAEIDRFLEEVADTFRGNITETISANANSQEEYSKFGVRY